MSDMTFTETHMETLSPRNSNLLYQRRALELLGKIKAGASK